MKVTKNINDKGIEEIVIIITKEDAELLQIAILQCEVSSSWEQ